MSRNPPDIDSVGLYACVPAFLQEFVGLAHKRLGELEAEYGGVEPVEIGASVLGLLDERIEQLVLVAGFVSKDESFGTFVQGKLSFLSAHYRRYQTNKSQRRYSAGLMKESLQATIPIIGLCRFDLSRKLVFSG